MPREADPADTTVSLDRSDSRPGEVAGRRRRSRGPERFQDERRALRKVQVHFELRQSLMREVRMAAAMESLSSSDYVRRIVGLPYARIRRPRISLSFGDRDLELLAERYGQPEADTGTIKRRVMDEIRAHFDGATEAAGAGRGCARDRRHRGG